MVTTYGPSQYGASRRERIGAALLTGGVVATLGYALVMGLAFHGAPQAVQQALATFTVMPDPPPPERVVPPPQKINRPSGKASPPKPPTRTIDVPSDAEKRPRRGRPRKTGRPGA